MRTHGPDRLFYKGLIHAAVALHHLGNGNTRGAGKVFGSCTRYLDPYQPVYLGLHVAAFLLELCRCFAGLEGAGASEAPPAIERSQVPTIALDPSPGKSGWESTE